MREGKSAYRKDGMVLPTQGEEDSSMRGKADVNLGSGQIWAD